MPDSDPFTAAQEDHMRHALGLNQHGVKRPYRNRFWADPEGEDAHIWEPLVRAGYAVRSGARESYGGMVCFAVTDAGLSALWITDLRDLEASERFDSNPATPAREQADG